MPDSYHHGALRSALLDAATDLLTTDGVDGVTMRALAERTGVSRTAPYRHFANKDALLEAVAAEGFAQLQAILKRLAEGAPPASTKEAERVHFAEIGAAYVRFADAHPAHYRLMYGSDALARSAHPALQAAADAAYAELVRLLSDAQARGTIRSNVGSEQQAYIAWGLVHGLASLLVDGQMERPADVEALAGQAILALLDGLLVPA
ncbi:MAG: TetR/AcrR family transcriptional regulator [Bacteroidota bacterium]